MITTEEWLLAWHDIPARISNEPEVAEIVLRRAAAEAEEAGRQYLARHGDDGFPVGFTS